MKIRKLLNNKKYEKLIKMWRDPQYFLNWKDAKFSWEERRSLEYILDFLSALELKNLGTYIKFYDEDFINDEDPVDVEVFAIYRTDPNGIICQLSIFDSWERGNDIKHFLSLYKNHGTHWAAVKAGLRGIYDDNHISGKVGFERKPTNW